MTLPLRSALVFALTFVLACTGGSDTARIDLDSADKPVGELPDVFENTLHAAHLSGTTPLSCSRCHDTAASDFQVPPRDQCLGCHEKRRVLLHDDELECTECHAFGAGDKTDKIDCLRCHEKEQGDHMAIKAHASVDCRNCHRLHDDPALAVSECVGCHDGHMKTHGGRRQTMIERCSSCHEPHTQSLAAATQCEGCHEEDRLLKEFSGHFKCTTCHVGLPSEAPKKKVECESCHDPRFTLSAKLVPEHAKCENCHASHDPRGTASQSCQTCHAEVSSKHPSTEVGRCVGCHQPHPTTEDAIVSACSKCHDKAEADDSFHVSGRTKCSECHGSHDFEPAKCVSCHQAQAQLTSNLSKHAKCESCHKVAHAPQPSLEACAGCHLMEHETAPAKHRDCLKCHDPHSGRRLRAADCGNCHQKKPGMTHGQIEGGCKNCHRAHGPEGHAEPPACLTCHSRKKLPGLHSVDDHDRCTTCHEGHGMRELVRKTCLSNCHEEQTKHEAVAKTCVACHEFGASR